MKIFVLVLVWAMALAAWAQGSADAVSAFNNGVVLKSQKRFNDAADEFKRAITLADGAGDPKLQNAAARAKEQMVACRLLAADSLYKKGDFAQAIAALDIAQASAKTYNDAANQKLADEAMPRMIFAQGISAMEDGNYEDALGFFDRSLKLNPAQSGALMYMGVCYIKLNNAQEALKFYEKAIQAAAAQNKPADAAQARKAASSYLFSLGQDAKDSRHYDRAYKYFAMLPKFDPQNGEAYLQMAISANYGKKYGDAIAAAQKGIEVEKRMLQTSQIAYQLAYAHEQNAPESPDKACEYYQKSAVSTDDETRQNSKDAIRRLRCGR